jgi:hypothetical protein
MRRQAGQLEAKVFQEKNAQSLLVEGELKLSTAKTQYQQGKTDTDKHEAIKVWRNAINNLEQIPSVTLAGTNAQQKLIAYQEELEKVVGLMANNDKVETFINSARQFSSQASQRGKNPPYQVAEWQEIEKLWQMAINELQKISSDDLEGYTQASKLIAVYNTNLAEVRIRLKAEEKSLESLESAQKLITQLTANLPTEINSSNINQAISQIQSIIDELDRVEKGTTSYSKAQELKYFAQNKLKQLQYP